MLDNFDWAFGFSRRFGIVYVDFETLERVPKDSFAWYRDFIAAKPRMPSGGEFAKLLLRVASFASRSTTKEGE